MSPNFFLNSISLDEELWKQIPDWEDYYISSHGRVASIKSKKLLTPTLTNSRGKTYYSVRFRDKGRRKHCTIHRLLAKAFIPNPNNYPCIDHIDGNSTNNNLSNLRWCTIATNNTTISALQRQSNSHIGKKMSFRKPVVQLKEGEVIKIYDYLSETAKDGFTYKCVDSVCKGLSPQHKGYQWMYLSDYNNRTAE